MSDIGRKKCKYFGAALLLFFFSLFFYSIQKHYFSAPSLVLVRKRTDALPLSPLLSFQLLVPSLFTPDGR